MMFNINADNIKGLWVTKDADLIVECYTKNNMYYGKVVWFKDENPHRKKYSRRGIPKDEWVGYDVMSGFKFNEDKNRWEGKITNIKYGGEYEAYANLKNGQLIVTGYVLIPIFSKQLIFTKIK